jgi:hypothetical protein
MAFDYDGQHTFFAAARITLFRLLRYVIEGIMTACNEA